MAENIHITKKRSWFGKLLRAPGIFAEDYRLCRNTGSTRIESLKISYTLVKVLMTAKESQA